MLVLSGFSQSQSSDYEEYLKLLPESVRSSVERRIGNDTEDLSNYDQINNSDLLRQNIQLQKDSILEEPKTDEYGNIVPSFFGYELFKNSTNIFNPQGILPAPNNYVLGPGDELTISFSGSIQAIKKVSINREGNIFLKELGSVSLSGMTFEEAATSIDNIAEATLIGTKISLSLSRLRTIQIFILGNSKNPGAYTVTPLSTISNVIFTTGGPLETGSLRNISLKRSNTEIGSLDLYDLLINGNTNDDLRIQSGDVLLVNPVGSRVKIWGNVNRPAIYELLDGESFNNLINFASGFSSGADTSRLTLSRINDRGQREFQDFSSDELRNTDLKDSDEIFVHDLSQKSKNEIKIIGASLSKGRYSYKNDIVLDNFLNADDMSDDTYLSFGIISRRVSSSSREYLPISLDEKSRKNLKLRPNDIVYVFSQDDIDFLNSALVADALGLLSSEEQGELDIFYKKEKERQLQDKSNQIQEQQEVLNSSTLRVIERDRENKRDREKERDLLLEKGLVKFEADDRYPCKSLKYIATFNASSLVETLKNLKFSTSETNIKDRLGLNEGCPKLYEDSPDLLIVALENATLISGEVRKPGFYPATNNFSIPNLTSYAGGATNLGKSGSYEIYYSSENIVNLPFSQSSSFIEAELFPKSIVLQQDPSKQETFSVSISGFIKNPGTYSISKGERLSSLLKRAGGYEKNAYPYGGVFTRSSVAVREKKAFLRAADELEEGIATSLTSGAISDTGNPQLASSVISNLITRLKNIEPVGRIVTEMDLKKLKKNPESDIVLNSGDRIFIPSEKSTVTVTGQVLAPTSFVFSKRLKINDYIKLAGGFADSADKKGLFVILPNGQAIKNLDKWRMGRTVIEPGSTIIVPRDSSPVNALAIFRIFTPILANFATAAAAISAID